MDYNEYLASRLAEAADTWEKMAGANNSADPYCSGYAAALRDLAGRGNRLGDLEFYHNEWKKL